LNTELIINIVLLAGCFLFSGIFSGSEVALFSLDPEKVRRRERKGFTNHYLRILLEYPKRLLVTLLIGNNIVNVAASILGVNLALIVAAEYKIDKDIALFAEISVLTVSLIFLSELTPKVIARKNPEKFAAIIAIPMYLAYSFLYPVAEGINEMLRLIFTKFKLNNSVSALKNDELRQLAQVGLERGTIEDNQQRIIDSFVDFRNKTVREIMKPRLDIIALDAEVTFTEVVEAIKKSGYSRLPVYRDDIDEIVGMVYSKDLLPFLKDERKLRAFSLLKVMRKVIFVPESKFISDLLKEFQEKKIHLAIVVDEYGGTSGLVTLEDVLEEVVGEIQDEFDKEVQQIIKVDKNRYIVSGSTSIDQLNKILPDGVIIPEEDYESVGGFILSQTENFPGKNYTFTFKDIKFKVTEIDNKRIKKVLVEIYETTASD